MKKRLLSLFLCSLFVCSMFQSTSANSPDISTYEVCEELIIQNYSMQQEELEQYNITFQVSYGTQTYNSNISCKFIKFNTDYMYTYNKNIAHVMDSNYEVLYFSLSHNNDILNQDKPVEAGKTLVQIVFVVDDIQKILSAYTFMDTAELPLREENYLPEYIPDGISDEAVQEAMQSVTWFAPFYNNVAEHTENHTDGINIPSGSVLNHFDLNVDNTNVVDEIEVQEYIYTPNGQFTAKDSMISPMTVIDGDSSVLENMFDLNELRYGGCRHGLKQNTAQTRYTHGWKVCAIVRQPDRITISNIAIWDINHNITDVPGGASTQRYLEFSVRKAYNIFTEFRINSNVLKITYAPADSTYLITKSPTIGVKLTGKGYAYLDRAKYEVNQGGGSGGSTLLEWGINQGATVLGYVYPVFGVVSDVFCALTDLLDVYSSAVYNTAQKEFEMPTSSNAKLKAVASTYTKDLYKQNSILKTRVRLSDWDSVAQQKQKRVYYQVDFNVDSCIYTVDRCNQFSFYFYETIV